LVVVVVVVVVMMVFVGVTIHKIFLIHFMLWSSTDGQWHLV
jgi:hypothetical protein